MGKFKCTICGEVHDENDTESYHQIENIAVREDDQGNKEYGYKILN